MLFAYRKIDKVWKNSPTLWKYTTLADSMRINQILSDAWDTYF